MKRVIYAVLVLIVAAIGPASTASVPTRAAHGMVVSQNTIASTIGVQVLKDGGSAADSSSSGRRPATRWRTTSAR